MYEKNSDQIMLQTSTTSGWRLTSSDSSHIICKVPVATPIMTENWYNINYKPKYGNNLTK